MTNADLTGTQATSTTQELGTMHGMRGIQFTFTTVRGEKKTVTLDFYGNGSAFNGATYARCEAACLRAMVTAGHEVRPNWTHFLIG